MKNVHSWRWTAIIFIVVAFVLAVMLAGQQHYLKKADGEIEGLKQGVMAAAESIAKLAASAEESVEVYKKYDRPIENQFRREAQAQLDAYSLSLKILNGEIETALWENAR